MRNYGNLVAGHANVGDGARRLAGSNSLFREGILSDASGFWKPPSRLASNGTESSIRKSPGKPPPFPLEPLATLPEDLFLLAIRAAGRSVDYSAGLSAGFSPSAGLGWDCLTS